MWIVTEQEAYEIVGFNMIEKGEAAEVWVTKPTGKTAKIFTGTKEEAFRLRLDLEMSLMNSKTYSI